MTPHYKQFLKWLRGICEEFYVKYYLYNQKLTKQEIKQQCEDAYYIMADKDWLPHIFPIIDISEHFWDIDTIIECVNNDYDPERVHDWYWYAHAQHEADNENKYSLNLKAYMHMRRPDEGADEFATRYQKERDNQIAEQATPEYKAQEEARMKELLDDFARKYIQK